ncbi:MAG: hypothetical protein IJW37_00120, partial [Lachnospiraceae bacterium]|nr:hypothetical protein [Lachnospiraceae bacterium]
MRKIGLYLVGICMMFSLAACGGSTEESKENDDIKTEQVSKDLTDAEDKEEDSDAESEGGVQEEISSTEEISYEPTQQVLDAKWHSGLVQVNDKVISLPCKLSDLLAMGFDYEIDDGDEEKGYLFAQNDYVAYNLLLNGERVCFQSFSNKKEGFLTLEDIDPEIESVSLVMRDPGNVTFFLPGGLTLGDAMSSIEEKLGPALGTEAQNESIIYNYGDSSFLSEQLQLGLLLFADRTTQQITSFSIAKNVEYSSVEDATTITAENINNLQSADSHNVQVLFA